MNEEGILRDIQQILNEGYGEQATSALDRVVARNILNFLRATNWITHEEFAIVVEAAGGTVVIPDKVLTEDPPEVLRMWRDIDDSLVITTRITKVIPGEVVDDRPDIEHRTVESGPIKARTV